MKLQDLTDAFEDCKQNFAEKAQREKAELLANRAEFNATLFDLVVENVQNKFKTFFKKHRPLLCIEKSERMNKIEKAKMMEREVDDAKIGLFIASIRADVNRVMHREGRVTRANIIREIKEKADYTDKLIKLHWYQLLSEILERGLENNFLDVKDRNKIISEINKEQVKIGAKKKEVVEKIDKAEVVKKKSGNSKNVEIKKQLSLTELRQKFGLPPVPKKRRYRLDESASTEGNGGCGVQYHHGDIHIGR